MPAKESPICPHCHMGYLKPTTQTYVALVNDLLLSAPDMPGWKCDICQFLEFDEDMMFRLDALVGGMEAAGDNERAGARPVDGKPDSKTDGKPDSSTAHRAKH